MARAASKSKSPADPNEIRPSELEGIPLGEHEGKPITGVAAKITGAGDGLSESLNLSPVHLPMGGKGFALVPYEVVSHEYDFPKTGKDRVEDEMLETAVIKAEGCLLLDPDLVRDVAAQHRLRIEDARAAAEKAKREAKGEFELPLAEGGANDDGDGSGSE